MSGHEDFTLAQIEGELEKLNYNVLVLKDCNGLKILNANSPKTSREMQLSKIKGLLNSRACPDGPYSIEARPQLKSDQRPLVFQYWKGTKSNGHHREARPQLSESSEAMTKPILPAEIFQLYSENATLRGDNESLKRQNLALDARVEHLEEIIEELRGQNQTLSEGAAKGPGALEVLKEAAPHIPAIIQSIQHLFKPPQPMAQGPDPKLAQAINQILTNKQLMSKRLEGLEAQLEEIEEEEDDDTPLNAQELYDGLKAGDFSSAEVQEYLNRSDPQLRIEYERFKKQQGE